MTTDIKGTIEMFPALRCSVGIWTFYLTAMPFKEVADRVFRVPRHVDNQELNRLLQRELRTSKLRDIASYLQIEPERFFGAVVIGVEGGDPEWHPIELQAGLYGSLNIDSRFFAEFLGVIELDRTERMFTIDGQHRVEGIKQAIIDNPDLETEQLPVVFVAHIPTERGIRRTRKLFATLNKYATPVSPGDLIMLDEDDGYAIATRGLVKNHSSLSKSGLVDDETVWMVDPSRSVQLPKKNRHSFTSIVSLHNQALALYPARGRERTTLRTRRPEDTKLAHIEEYLGSYFDVLRRHNPTLKAVFNATPGDKVIRKLRSNKGGHYLLRPAGQQAFCEATRVMMFRGVRMDEAVGKLSEVPGQLDSFPWFGVLWDGDKVMSADARLNRNLLLYMVGEPVDPAPGPTPYSFEKHYLRIAGERAGELPNPLFRRKNRRKPVGLNGS